MMIIIIVIIKPNSDFLCVEFGLQELLLGVDLVNLTLIFYMDSTGIL